MKFWIALTAIAMLTGCAAPADVQPMTAQAAGATPTDPALARAVCVERVDGGKKTNPLWVSEVDNRSFLRALEGSLRLSGLLADPPERCRFGVDAHLLGLSQPFIGFDVRVTANVNYRVRQAGVTEPYFLKTTTAAHTAKFTADKVLWASRLKLANEGAIRENIASFIEALLLRPAPG